MIGISIDQSYDKKSVVCICCKNLPSSSPIQWEMVLNKPQVLQRTTEEHVLVVLVVFQNLQT